jgi:plastocyanin
VTANLQAGEYDLHCAVHPFMTGQIIVSATEKEEQQEEQQS